MIEFRDSTDVIIGVIATRGNKLLSSVTMESVAASWLRSRGSAAGFEDAYSNWTNGYVTGVRVNDDQAVVRSLSEVQVSGMVP